MLSLGSRYNSGSVRFRKKRNFSLFPNAPQKGSHLKVGGLGVGRLPNIVALCPQSVRKASAKRPQSVREASAKRSRSVREWRNAAEKGELHRTRVPAAFSIRQAKGELPGTRVAVRGVPNPSS